MPALRLQAVAAASGIRQAQAATFGNWLEHASLYDFGSFILYFWKTF
jgi:hypothetical protein